MSNLIKTDTNYAEWIKSLSLRFRQSQIKAAVKVNSELIRFYWELGRDIVELKAEERWKENFWENLSHDLQTALPGVKGFSITNLQYTRRFYLLYSMTTNEHPQVGGAWENGMSDREHPQVGGVSKSIHYQYENEILSPLVTQICCVPWGHHKGECAGPICLGRLQPTVRHLRI